MMFPLTESVLNSFNRLNPNSVRDASNSVQNIKWIVPPDFSWDNFEVSPIKTLRVIVDKDPDRLIIYRYFQGKRKEVLTYKNTAQEDIRALTEILEWIVDYV